MVIFYIKVKKNSMLYYFKKKKFTKKNKKAHLINLFKIFYFSINKLNKVNSIFTYSKTDVYSGQNINIRTNSLVQYCSL
jgi:hypothetical protein